MENYLNYSFQNAISSIKWSMYVETGISSAIIRLKSTISAEFRQAGRVPIFNILLKDQNYYDRTINVAWA